MNRGKITFLLFRGNSLELMADAAPVHYAYDVKSTHASFEKFLCEREIDLLYFFLAQQFVVYLCESSFFPYCVFVVFIRKLCTKCTFSVIFAQVMLLEAGVEKITPSILCK